MMAMGRLITVMVLVLLLATAGEGQARSLEFRDYTLANGMRVILLQTHRAPLIFSQIWYRVGAVDEVAGKTGLAHMLEHMMFKGTKTLKPGEYSRLIARHGGEDNAATTLDFTNYHAKLAADQLALALRLEADRMRGLKLLEKEFRSENDVVQEERRTRTENTPDGRFQEKFRQEIFRVHPYGRPVIGFMKDIQGLTLADLQAWYDRYYSPNNAILVVVGDFEFDAASGLVDKYFARLSANSDLKPADIPAEPEQNDPRRVQVMEKGVAVARWNMAFHAPSLAKAEQQADVYALDILSSLLADGGSSRLYRDLIVEKKLALSVGAAIDGIGRYPSTLMITATAKPKVDLNLLEEAILAHIQRLRQELVTEQELEKVKNGLLADHVFAKDSVDHLAWAVGEMAAAGIDWQEVLFHYPEHIRAVTASQVLQAAQRYLDPQKATIATLTSSEKTGTP